MLNHESLIKMKKEADYAGFGYLGHECRSHEVDEIVLAILNEADMDYAKAFAFLNSRYGRFMGDEIYSGRNVADTCRK